jgi:hypothetical protein
MIEVKILGYHPAQRYALRQILLSAKHALSSEHPEVEIVITELKDWMHIEQYTPVLSAPSLVVNEKLVSVGRFPSRLEVLGWLKEAVVGISST